MSQKWLPNWRPTWSPEMMPTWLYYQDLTKFRLNHHYNLLTFIGFYEPSRNNGRYGKTCRQQIIHCQNKLSIPKIFTHASDWRFLSPNHSKVQLVVSNGTALTGDKGGSRGTLRARVRHSPRGGHGHDLVLIGDPAALCLCHPRSCFSGNRVILSGEFFSERVIVDEPERGDGLFVANLRTSQ
ncbi:hypothetical protein TNCV_4972231 [Trichonephila clavipes]|nr:hypothetical protein TNCV_4972231 [Trichonephila clavipes]